MKKYDIQTNTVTTHLLLSDDKGDFIGLQPRLQKIFFYVNSEMDISLEEILNQHNIKIKEGKEKDNEEYCYNGEIKCPSSVINIYLLRIDILGCNDEESVFLINIPKKLIIAQILLGLKVYCSSVTYDLSLIFFAKNKKAENKEEAEFIQYKLNHDKDNMIRLRNKQRKMPGVDQLFCLPNKSIIFYDSTKSNIIVMRSNKDHK